MMTIESSAATSVGTTGNSKRAPIFVAAVAILAIVGAAIWWFGVGDSEGDFEPVEVTGISDCSEWPRCTETMSDPRVSGEGFVEVEKWDQTTGELVGTYEIVNDGGSWKGTFAGIDDGASEAWAEAVMIGADDYEGLQYRYLIEFGASETGDHLMTGTIESVP
jgi:hypothetical protein